MALQGNSNYRITIKDQSALGTPASGGSAVVYDFAGGEGVRLIASNIEDPTLRSDGMSPADGIGFRNGTAVFQMALGVTKQDALWPRLLRRSAWQTLGPFSESDFTSMTTTTNTMVFAGGSARTLGIRRGMQVMLTNHSTPANNSKWLDVLAISQDGRTITTKAGALTANAVADNAFTLTVAKHAYQATSLVKVYQTIEQLALDISNAREVLTDSVLGKFAFQAGPDAKALGTFSWVGLDVDPDDTTGSSIFTSPTTQSGYNMEMSDGYIIKDGVVRNIVTDLNFDYDLQATVEKILGAVGEDVTMGLAKGTGSLSSNRTNLEWVKGFKNKTPFEMLIKVQEPDSDPKDFLSFYFGKCVPQSPSPSFGKSGNSKDSVPFTLGIDDNGGDRASTMMLISSTAP